MPMPTQDLVSIAAAGGGFRIEAQKYSTDDLVGIAAAASKHKPPIVLENAGYLPVNDLLMIATAGKGAVHFLLPTSL